MTIGTSLFLSSLFISIAIIYGFTKDRWNWKRIFKWTLLGPIALGLLVGLGVYGYDTWEQRPKPQMVFMDIALDATRSEVSFVKGVPTEYAGPFAWIYRMENQFDHTKEEIVIKFIDDRIRFILYTSDKQQYRNPLQGFVIGTTYSDVLDKLGPPSNISNSKDNLDRIASYERFNTFYTFRQAQLIGYGIYQTKDGPVQFNGEEKESSPSNNKND